MTGLAQYNSYIAFAKARIGMQADACHVLVHFNVVFPAVQHICEHATALAGLLCLIVYLPCSRLKSFPCTKTLRMAGHSRPRLSLLLPLPSSSSSRSRHPHTSSHITTHIRLLTPSANFDNSSLLTPSFIGHPTPNPSFSFGFGIIWKCT